MKKLLLLFMTLALCITTNAQNLTVKEVLKKAANSVDITSGIKGKATIKMAGLGGTVSFETNGIDTRIVDGEDVCYINDDVSYDYEKKTNTITITKGDDDAAMLLMPYVLVKALFVEEAKADWQKFKMEKEKDGYEVKTELEGQKMTFLIDSKTFQIKNMKIKKAFITLMSLTYSNITPFKNFASLKYDKSKYPNAKIVDERGKESASKKTSKKK